MQTIIEVPDQDLDSPYCEHGNYVGGMGIDYLCHWCESGTPFDEYVAIMQIRENREQRARTAHAYLLTILDHGALDEVPEFILKMFGALLRTMKGEVS